MPYGAGSFRIPVTRFAAPVACGERRESSLRLLCALTVAIVSSLAVALVLRETEGFSLMAGVFAGLYYYFLRRSSANDSVGAGKP